MIILWYPALGLTTLDFIVTSDFISALHRKLLNATYSTKQDIFLLRKLLLEYIKYTFNEN